MVLCAVILACHHQREHHQYHHHHAISSIRMIKATPSLLLPSSSSSSRTSIPSAGTTSMHHHHRHCPANRPRCSVSPIFLKAKFQTDFPTLGAAAEVRFTTWGMYSPSFFPVLQQIQEKGNWNRRFSRLCMYFFVARLVGSVSEIRTLLSKMA